jgi:hypothetical protein
MSRLLESAGKFYGKLHSQPKLFLAYRTHTLGSQVGCALLAAWANRGWDGGHRRGEIRTNRSLFVFANLSGAKSVELGTSPLVKWLR